MASIEEEIQDLIDELRNRPEPDITEIELLEETLELRKKRQEGKQ